ncbi:MAG: hypothetical protein UY19_C0021G0005 [Candidatus Wolfebacteria bacterium GW2011_GWA2_47_9b]|uniref:Uncharacterized protein n=1 Tax=Candidatus Wolfebacteria bacterium GW2011_GWA2_47_9b TaxID=1619005 RepID=A0A0G1X3G3_9BACT|nr:MAG: hypothetical protein UY19_C0021G0005 [Candidatus Wolfebacteria bacterium GW2011_GWA2_47_9b]
MEGLPRRTEEQVDEKVERIANEIKKQDIRYHKYRK